MDLEGQTPCNALRHGAVGPSPQDGAGAEPASGNCFVATYPPFSCWSTEATTELERALEVAADALRPLGLYVHIPFCARRCDYCYYLSYDDRAGEIDRYLEALGIELSLWAGTPAIRGRRLDFAYFGGGTPSLLSCGRIRRLLARLQGILPWGDAREVTFECAPRSVTEEKLAVLRQAGVTRFSLGVQDLDDRVLRLNGRVHLAADVARAWEAASMIGFPIRNIDLIAGLPGQTEGSFLASVERVLAMTPESVTIYQLEIPHNTPLFRALQGAGEKAPAPAGWEARRARAEAGFALLESAGYTVRSGYTAVLDPERHAFLYQDEQYRGGDLLGVGASSFSYLGGVHHQNLADLRRYLDRLSADRLPLWRAHRLDADERLVRELVLQLKLGGVDRHDFREKFGVEVTERFAGQLRELANEGWLRVEGERIRMTRSGLLRVDRLLPRFYAGAHRGVPYA